MRSKHYLIIGWLWVSLCKHRILHMQILAPFCFACGRHLEKGFSAAKLLAAHSVCLWRYGPISMWRWIIFFIFVDVWPFLSLARGLYAYNINNWSLCNGKHRLKQIRGLSGLQTSMVLPTLLLSAVQRRIERWRERWRSIRTSCLPPEAESGETKGDFYGPGCFNNSVEDLDRVRVLLFAKGNAKEKSSLKAREAFGRHGAGCVTSFSVTRSRPRAGQPEAPPGGGLAWACME